MSFSIKSYDDVIDCNPSKIAEGAMKIDDVIIRPKNAAICYFY